MNGAPPSRPAQNRTTAGGRAAALALLAATPLVGCVHVYHPLSGLHDPVVVDPTAPNLADTRVTLRCHPGDLLTRAEASLLCRRVSTLLENQGAQVIAATTGTPFAEDVPEEGTPVPTTDLVVELRSRKVLEHSPPLNWYLSYITLTLLPVTREEIFAQDVVVRDADGFLLARETLQGRLVHSYGAGVWVANRILDVFWRDESEQLTGDAAARDLSADLYGQLSQIVFNARMQSRVLREGPPAPPAP